jgi:hypothetical protein
MQDRWGDALRNDPAYNPNLSLQNNDFQLAFPPRGNNVHRVEKPHEASG